MVKKYGVEVQISGNNKKLLAALKKSQKETKKYRDLAEKAIGKDVAKSAEKAAKSVSKIEKAFALAKKAAIAFTAIRIGKNLVAGLSAANKEIQEFATFADTLGVSVNKLQQFEFALTSVGFKADKAFDILKDVEDKFGDAFGTGGGAVANDLTDLGISLDKFLGKDPVEKLIELAKATRQLSTERRVFLFESVANDASKLIPLLDQNAARLREMNKEFKELGLGFTKQQVTNAQAFTNSINKMQIIWSTFTRMLSAELAPAFAPLFKSLDDYIKRSGGLRKVTQQIAKGILSIGIVVLNTFDKAFKAVRIFAINVQKVFLNLGKKILEFVAMVTSAVSRVPGIDLTDTTHTAIKDIRNIESAVGELDDRISAIGKEKNPLSNFIDQLIGIRSRIGKDVTLADEAARIFDFTRAATQAEKKAAKEREKAAKKAEKERQKALKDMMKKKTALEKLKSLYQQNKQAASGLAQVEQGGGLIAQLQTAAKKSSELVATSEGARNRELFEAGLQFLRRGADPSAATAQKIQLEITVDKDGIIKPVVKSQQFENEVEVIVRQQTSAQATINDR